MYLHHFTSLRFRKHSLVHGARFYCILFVEQCVTVSSVSVPTDRVYGHHLLVRWSVSSLLLLVTCCWWTS